MRTFLPILTVTENRKGVLDVDTVKGCALGMSAYPNGGCYGECYACKIARCNGYDFSTAISRQPLDENVSGIEKTVATHAASWFRIGTMGDPSHDWPLTLYVSEWLGKLKTPIIVTKHWREIPAAMARRLASVGAIFNTSISALDTDAERDYRLGQFYRLKSYGIKSFLRIVTAAFGSTDHGKYLSCIQQWLMMHGPAIDTPLRIPACSELVKNGTVTIMRINDINGMANVSRWNNQVYIGKCKTCPDQCGATMCGETK